MKAKEQMSLQSPEMQEQMQISKSKMKKLKKRKMQELFSGYDDYLTIDDLQRHRNKVEEWTYYSKEQLAEIKKIEEEDARNVNITEEGKERIRAHRSEYNQVQDKRKGFLNLLDRLNIKNEL